MSSVNLLQMQRQRKLWFGAPKGNAHWFCGKAFTFRVKVQGPDYPLTVVDCVGSFSSVELPMDTFPSPLVPYRTEIWCQTFLFFFFNNL